MTSINGVWPVLLGLALSLLGHFGALNVSGSDGYAAFRSNASDQPLSALQVDADARVNGTVTKPLQQANAAAATARDAVATRTGASYLLASTAQPDQISVPSPALGHQRQRAPPRAHG